MERALYQSMGRDRNGRSHCRPGTGNRLVVRLVLDDDTIRDAYGNPLGGIGDGNGQVLADESYLVRLHYSYLPILVK